MNLDLAIALYIGVAVLFGGGAVALVVLIVRDSWRRR